MKQKLHFARQARAFTLIEILVAVTIFAVVLAAISSVMFAGFRLRNATARTLEESLPAQQAIRTIKRDLANLVPPGGTMFGALQSPSLSGLALPGQISPAFYTSTAILDDTVPWGEVQKVYYALNEPTNRTSTGRDLFRAVNQNLLPVLTEELAEQHFLMGGVQNVLFFYFDGTSWRDSWDTTTADPVTGQTNTLPQAIKVQIQLAQADGVRRNPQESPIEIVVPIVVQGRTNQTAAAAQ